MSHSLDRPRSGATSATAATLAPAADVPANPLTERLKQALRQHYQAIEDVRRGVCLLNAGDYQSAVVAFSRATACGSNVTSLPAYLGSCYLAQGRNSDALRQFRKAAEQVDASAPAQVRYAFALRGMGKMDDAIQVLRQAIAVTPENAELHFQLGTLLAEIEQFDEAELRFTQAAAIDKDHTDALVSLAMCCGVRHAADESVRYLRRAQARRPHDPSIGVLLAHAARAAQAGSGTTGISATMPVDSARHDRQGLQRLVEIVEADPEFVEAFLAIPADDVEPDVYRMLLTTIERALERRPEVAELHYHCGQVLRRLGRSDEAIHANERAVGINPRYVAALVELGSLYRQIHRTKDAAQRLEQAVIAGGEYADVFVQLGHVYKELGSVTNARAAYTKAIELNGEFQEAKVALQTLHPQGTPVDVATS